MKNKPQTFAGIGGLLGAILSGVGAFLQYDFSVTDQMQMGIGYIVGGLFIGALAGYAIGKAMKS